MITRNHYIAVRMYAENSKEMVSNLYRIMQSVGMEQALTPDNVETIDSMGRLCDSIVAYCKFNLEIYDKKDWISLLKAYDASTPPQRTSRWW